MTSNQFKHLPKATISADRNALLALKQLPDYSPFSPTLQAGAISELEATLRQAEADEFHAQNALKAARHARAQAGHNLHEAIMNAKLAVSSQYGPNSDAIQSLGLKKKVEYRRRGRRTEQ